MTPIEVFSAVMFGILIPAVIILAVKFDGLEKRLSRTQVGDMQYREIQDRRIKRIESRLDEKVRPGEFELR